MAQFQSVEMNFVISKEHDLVVDEVIKKVRQVALAYSARLTLHPPGSDPLAPKPEVTQPLTPQ